MTFTSAEPSVKSSIIPSPVLDLRYHIPELGHIMRVVVTRTSPWFDGTDSHKLNVCSSRMSASSAVSSPLRNFPMGADRREMQEPSQGHSGGNMCTELSECFRIIKLGTSRRLSLLRSGCLCMGPPPPRNCWCIIFQALCPLVMDGRRYPFCTVRTLH
jgi:hypothetical protein